tara:strand:+ start:703 stop:1107 length:405 start_codon:yes stop_codon:yes gene_type:complete
MIEDTSHHELESASERNFGFVFSSVFLVIALYPLWFEENIHIWALIISFIFLFFSIFFTKILVFPNKLWHKFGLLLGAIVSPIIMGIIFFLTVTPTGIIMRILGKDILKQKINKNVKSYWINKEKTDTSMKNQF